MEAGAIDSVNVAADDKPDLRFLAWKKVGEVPLSRGRHTVAFRMSKKWSIATPMVLGQFPAAALLYRKGYLKQGEPAVVEHRSLRQLWEPTCRRSPRTRAMTPTATQGTRPGGRASRGASTRSRSWSGR